MAHPDALISAVGTKIYSHEGGAWREDAAWAASLNEAWSVTVVREASYQALAAVGRDRMHFRPPEEQNEHKVSMAEEGHLCDDLIALRPSIIITSAPIFAALHPRCSVPPLLHRSRAGSTSMRCVRSSPVYASFWMPAGCRPTSSPAAVGTGVT